MELTIAFKIKTNEINRLFQKSPESSKLTIPLKIFMGEGSICEWLTSKSKNITNNWETNRVIKYFLLIFWNGVKRFIKFVTFLLLF